MPVIQLEVSYVVQGYSQRRWTDLMYPVASLRVAVREYDNNLEKYGKDNLRVVKETLRRETVDIE